MYSCRAWSPLYNHRPSHPFNARTRARRVGPGVSKCNQLVAKRVKNGSPPPPLCPTFLPHSPPTPSSAGGPATDKNCSRVSSPVSVWDGFSPAASRIPCSEDRQRPQSGPVPALPHGVEQLGQRRETEQRAKRVHRQCPSEGNGREGGRRREGGEGVGNANWAIARNQPDSDRPDSDQKLKRTRRNTLYFVTRKRRRRSKTRVTARSRNLLMLYSQVQTFEIIF